MGGDQVQDGGLCAAQIVLGLERIQRVGRHQLARGIHHRGLYAGADARVQPEGRAGSGWRSKQQVLEIACKNLNGLLLRAASQIGHQLDHHRQ